MVRVKRGRSYGMGFKTILKLWSVLLLLMYVVFFLLVFYAAFSNEATYTAIIAINAVGEAFLEAVLLVPLTLLLIVVGLYFIFREKSRFNANLSYEMRTSLNNIIGYVEMLQEQQVGKITAQQQDDLNVMHRDAKSILKTIDDIDALWR